MDTCSSTIKRHALPYLLPLRYLCCSLLKSRLRRFKTKVDNNIAEEREKTLGSGHLQRLDRRIT